MGSASENAPSDSPDTGGAREAKENKSKAETFERSMSNAERPDRAPATTNEPNNNRAGGPEGGDTTAGYSGPNPDPRGPALDNGPTDQQDEDSRSTTQQANTVTGPTGPHEGGIFSGLVDTLTAPPTDANGNLRSTSPVSDRLNNTVNYSADDVANFFGFNATNPALTPEQSQTLANGAAVLDGVMVTPSPKEQIDLYQADLRLQRRGLEYQRDTLEKGLESFSPGNQFHHPNRQEIREIDQQIQHISERRDALARMSRADLETGQVPEVLHFDPAADGQIVVAYGNIENASHIAVMVPGMGTNLENFTEFNKKSIELMEDLNRQPGVSPAVVSYLGYDAPDYFEALSSRRAVEGAPALRDFINDLPEDAYVQAFAHSYGSLLAGEALKQGARPDALHILGSPGSGVDAVSEYNHNGEVVVSATENPWDPVADTNYYGQVPPEDAINYPSTGTGHFFEQYFDATVFRDIMTGRRQPIADN